MSKMRIFGFETSFLLLSIAFSAALFLGASKLPSPVFEPLGSAAFPKAIALILFILLCLKFYFIFSSPRAGGQDKSKNGGGLLKSVGLFFVVLAYVATLSFFNVSFWALTFLFVFISVVYIKRKMRTAGLFSVAACSLLFSLLSGYVFNGLFNFGI